MAALFIHGIHNLNRTDVKCTWKKHKTPDITRTVEELYPPTKEYNPLKEEIREEDCASFYNDLKTCGQFTGLAWLLSPEPVQREVNLPIKSVEDIIISKEFVDSGLDLNFLLEKLKITDQQQVAVHEATIGQRDNPKWHVLRRGRLTASNFGHVLNAKRATPSLIKRVMGQYNLSRVKAISWGISNESEGVKTFEDATGKQVQNSGSGISSILPIHSLRYTWSFSRWTG